MSGFLYDVFDDAGNYLGKCRIKYAPGLELVVSDFAYTVTAVSDRLFLQYADFDGAFETVVQKKELNPTPNTSVLHLERVPRKTPISVLTFDGRRPVKTLSYLHMVANMFNLGRDLAKVKHRAYVTLPMQALGIIALIWIAISVLIQNA